MEEIPKDVFVRVGSLDSQKKIRQLVEGVAAANGLVVSDEAMYPSYTKNWGVFPRGSVLITSYHRYGQLALVRLVARMQKQGVLTIIVDHDPGKPDRVRVNRDWCVDEEECAIHDPKGTKSFGRVYLLEMDLHGHRKEEKQWLTDVFQAGLSALFEGKGPDELAEERDRKIAHIQQLYGDMLAVFEAAKRTAL